MILVSVAIESNRPNSRGIAMSEDELREFFRKILEMLDALHKSANQSGVYDVNGAAKELGLRPWTVRRKCSLGMIVATLIEGRAGGQGEFRISAEEIERYKAEGDILPEKRQRPRRAA
jgi:hypothetical protein